MKKLLITLIILILWTSKGISQNSNDSITYIPNTQLKKAINIIENGKVVKQELDLYKERYTILEYRISVKDSTILQYFDKEALWNKKDANYKQQIFHYEEYVKNSQRIYDQQKKEIKGQKLKKWAGILCGIGIGYVLSK